jgi:L-2-hydroxyglutarate oxidase LhgO
MMNFKADILICGCGIVGLTIAQKLLLSGYENIVIIEKENAIGQHASGRNSGVLHAGIYYSPDSLRAQLCLQGNMLMKQYCKENGLPLLENHKVIVTKNEKELELLDELFNRATRNSAKVELIDNKQLSEIEPYAKTFQRALYAYDTAVIDPQLILKSLYNNLTSSGKVKILTGVEFKGMHGRNTLISNSGKIFFNTFINAAGAYSDKIAHHFGIGKQYKLIPFKGIYKKLVKHKSHMVNGNIYPVPDVRNPFLGIHFTKSISGDVYIGPTAMPAFGRENYGLLSGLDSEVFDILYRDVSLFISNPQFRKVATSEPKKYLFNNFYADVKHMVKNINPQDIEESSKVGIRPQLVDWKKKELLMDFLVIENENSIHILNAISPAFTSSMAFAEYIVKKYFQNR